MTQLFYGNAFVSVKSLHKSGTFWGYASTPSLDFSKDRVLQGAFQKSLDKWKHRGRWPHLYFEHDIEEFVGTCVDVQEDDHGLYIEGKLFLELSKAQDVYKNLCEGNEGLSIGFLIKKTYIAQGIRHIVEGDLKEISFVNHPCNPHARVEIFKNTEKNNTSSFFTLIQSLTKALKK